MEISKNRIEDSKIIPVIIKEDFIPHITNNQKKQEMLSFINKISEPIIEEKVNEKWWFEEIAKKHLVGNMESWIVKIKKYGRKHLLLCIKWVIFPFIVVLFGPLKEEVYEK